MVQESQASSFLEDGTPLASRVVLEAIMRQVKPHGVSDYYDSG